MREIRFKAYNDYELNLYIWDEVENPRGVVQLSHGMAEHLRRYDHFARFLNKNGIIVVGDDHRAHGRTSGMNELGITLDGDQCFFNTVKDLGLITDYLNETYKLPVVLLGHSYGSFLCQSYIQNYSDKIAGLVLTGTGHQNVALMNLTKIIASVQKAFCGGKKPAKMITKMGFASFDKPFKSENQLNAWLSRDLNQVIKYNADKECGYMCSIDFYLALSKGVSKMYTKQGLNNIRKDLPVFLACGAEDPVGEAGKAVEKLRDTYKSCGISNVKMKLYAGGRHEVLNETNQKEVYTDIVKFIISCIK